MFYFIVIQADLATAAGISLTSLQMQLDQRSQQLTLTTSKVRDLERQMADVISSLESGHFSAQLAPQVTYQTVTQVVEPPRVAAAAPAPSGYIPMKAPPSEVAAHNAAPIHVVKKSQSVREAQPVSESPRVIEKERSELAEKTKSSVSFPPIDSVNSSASMDSDAEAALRKKIGAEMRAYLRNELKRFERDMTLRQMDLVSQVVEGSMFGGVLSLFLKAIKQSSLYY